MAAALIPVVPFALVAVLGCSPDNSDPREPSLDQEGEAAAWFTEVQSSSGLDFHHVHGGSGERYMIETMTGGAALLDVDNDGFLDAYLVQSGPLPGFADQTPMPNRLYRNLGGDSPSGELAFEDITETSGAGDTGYGIGACAGDVDNNGFIDLYVTNLGQDTLLLHQGVDASGRVSFEDVTGQSGIDSPLYGSSCAFADFDRDGCLDLFVVNFVDFSLENNLRCGGENLPTYCSPDVYDGLPDQLYRGRCDGTFLDISEAAGVANHDPEQGKGLGVVWTDVDDDGFLDIYVANDSTRNFLYRNRGDGTFEDIAIFAGAAFNDRGQTEASMGIDVADYDGDGRLDLFMTHLDFESNTLYRNAGPGLFLDASAVSGLAAPSATRVGFGTNFFDYDHDGDNDLFVANGHILDNVKLRNPTLDYEQTNQLFENVGGRFADVSQRAGPHFSIPRVGRASATGDLDGDGDLDLLIVNSNRETVVLRNDRPRAESTSHWLMLRLASRYGGRDAIGARVRIFGGGRQWIDEIHSGTSYLAQGDLRLHFGLGEVREIERIEIRWPEGDEQNLDGADFPIDTLHEIRQPALGAPSS